MSSLLVQEYLRSLQKLEESDLDLCDPDLLRSLLSSLNQSSDYEDFKNRSVIISVYVEDMFDKKGPFKVPCVPSWLGKTCKEEFEKYFDLPACNQTLLVNFITVNDDQTLESAGITNSDSVLHVFLNHLPNPSLSEISDNIGLGCLNNEGPTSVVAVQETNQIDEEQLL